jgi:diadenosine tetraphosphate (Ap4A) HIT family hydrolase
MDTASTCPLCAKLSQLRELPDEDLVWQFPRSVALLGAWQYHTGYCVLVARTHAAELYELGDAERRAYLEEMCMLAKAIDRAFQPRKLNYEALGNQVPHLHWHLFPRRHDDPDVLKAVWLGFERAERDVAIKRQLETGPIPRSQITDRLRKTLRAFAAPSLITQ